MPNHHARRSIIATVILCALSTLIGCTIEHTVSMRADGNAVHRRTTTTTDQIVAEQIPADSNTIEVTSQTTTPPQPLFNGTFIGNTPDELKGQGTYQHFQSDLGHISIYAEHFQGNTDTLQSIQTLTHNADQLTNLLIEWFQSELADDPNWPTLHTFLDQSLRRDITNLALYIWSARLDTRSETSIGELSSRIFLYLANRNYFQPEQLPDLYRLFTLSTADEPTASAEAFTFIQRLIAQRMNIPDNQPVPQTLAFLSDKQTAIASFNDWYQTSDTRQQQLTEWRKQRDLNPDETEEDEPTAATLLHDLSESVISLNILGREIATIRFTHTTQPKLTNGTWQPETKSVVWNLAVDASTPTPALAYAFWLHHDTAAQQRILGHIIEEDQQLVSYVLWYNTADPETRALIKQATDQIRPNQPESRAQLIQLLESSGYDPDNPTTPTTFLQLLAAIEHNP